MKIRSVLRRMLCMCPDAWYIFIRSIQLCCVLLLCSFTLLLGWGGRMADNYELYMLATGLNEVSQSILLIAVLLSVIIEDAHLSSAKR